MSRRRSSRRRRRLRRLLVLGALGAVTGGIARRRRPEPAIAPARPPEWPALTARTVGATSDAPWVDPVDGACPLTHPVKGNASSRIYHVPGSRHYARTVPERCYRDPAAAEADGMRAPKR